MSRGELLEMGARRGGARVCVWGLGVHARRACSACCSGARSAPLSGGAAAEAQTAVRRWAGVPLRARRWNGWRGAAFGAPPFIDRVPHVAHARLCANERARHVANGNAAKIKTQSKRREPHRKKAKPKKQNTQHRAKASFTSLIGWEAVILACMAVCEHRWGDN